MLMNWNLNYRKKIVQGRKILTNVEVNKKRDLGKVLWT